MKTLPRLLATTAALGFSSFQALAQNAPSTPRHQVWIDFDLDGLPDLYVLGGPAIGSRDFLLRNLGDGRFEDATLAAGAGGRSSIHGRTADWDRNGTDDLLLVERSGLVTLLAAHDGLLLDAGVGANLATGDPIREAEWLDYDRDGWVDLVLTSEGGSPHVLHNEEGSGFRPIALGLRASQPPSITWPDERVTAVSAAPTFASGSEPATPANGRAPRADAPTRPAVLPADETPDAVRRRIPVPAPLQALPESTSMGVTGDAEPVGGTCVPALQDQSGGPCIEASRTPALDHFVPQSIELNTLGNNVNIGTSVPNAFDLNVVGDTRSSGLNGPTHGYLGIQGATPFDGIASAAWAGFDVGAGGISTGGSATDNYGVLGHSNGIGVRGEHSANPSVDYGELGAAGIGVQADGSVAAARFLGNAHFETTGGQVNLDIDEDNVGGASITGLDNDGTQTFFFDTDWANFGAPRMQFFEGTDGQLALDLDAGLSDDGGTIKVYDDAGRQTIELDGENGIGGGIEMFNEAGVETVQLYGDSSGGGRLDLRNDAGGLRLGLWGDSADGGLGQFYAADGSLTVVIDGEAGSGGGHIAGRNDTGEETISMIGDEADDSGEIRVIDRNGLTVRNSVTIDARDSVGTGGEIIMLANTGNVSVDIDGDNGGGALQLFESDGSVACDFLGSTYSFHNGAGTATISFNRLSGTKSAVVDTPSYGQRLFYVMESPEVWFEDFGTARLADGVARIDLDPIFLESVTVDEANPMMIHVTLTSPGAGVWAEAKGDHFLVREHPGGSRDATFNWRVVAKRKGVEGVRLESFGEVAASEAALLDPPAAPDAFRPVDGPDDRGSRSTGEVERASAPIIRQAVGRPVRPRSP